MKQQTVRALSSGSILWLASTLAIGLAPVPQAQASPIPYVVNNNGGLIDPFKQQEVAVSGKLDYDPATSSTTNFDVQLTTSLEFGGTYTEESEPSLFQKFGTWNINFFATSAFRYSYAIALFLNDQLGDAASYEIPYVSAFGPPDYTLLPANGMNRPTITRLDVGETAVPEPATWMLALPGGLLMILSLLRYGRRKSAIAAALVICALPSKATPIQTYNEWQIARLRALSQEAMKTYNLKSLIVRVTINSEDFYTEAMGESMSGVPATPDMHFRNGAMAFTYMSTILLELVDEMPQTVSLDDKLSKYLPELPESDKISLKNLANMTSGYADYVYQDELLKGLSLDPFQQWTSKELIQIGISKSMQFEPGTNWGYSHTNYVILGRVLEKITEMPLAQAMQKYIFERMKLKETRSISTPAIPRPVLHAFSSERRGDLHVPPAVPFYEESTFWNPSWTTAEGAVQITDIRDMARSMELVGTGQLLSFSSWRAQVAPNLIGFGHLDPDHCSACRQNTAAANYGLGIVNMGPWNTQTKNFAGSGATVGYLPGRGLTVAVATTYAPEAFDSTTGNYNNASGAIFALLGNALAPHTIVMPQ